MTSILGNLYDNLRNNKYFNDSLESIKTNKYFYSGLEVCNIAKEVFESV